MEKGGQWPIWIFQICTNGNSQRIHIERSANEVPFIVEMYEKYVCAYDYHANYHNLANKLTLSTLQWVMSFDGLSKPQGATT
jgi:hypothetical protein